MHNIIPQTHIKYDNNKINLKWSIYLRTFLLFRDSRHSIIVYFAYQDWADGDTHLLDVEKEKNEFYLGNEKENGYGATAANDQYKQGYDEEEEVYEDDADYYDQDEEWSQS